MAQKRPQSLCQVHAQQSNADDTEGSFRQVRHDAIYHRPGGKFCVSVFRQNREYHIIHVHDWGLFPLVASFSGGWDVMRALRSVNAVPASWES